MQEMLNQLRQQFAEFGPNLLAGLAVLIIGWVVAKIVAAVVRKVLSKVSVDNRIARWMAGPDSSATIPIEDWAAKGVFFLIMLIVIMAFLSTIKLTMVTDPLNSLVDPFLAYLPRLVAAALLVLVAWVLATVLKKILTAVLKASNLDERISGATATAKPIALSNTFAEAVYWLVFLLFLPAILQALDLQSLLQPVTNLFNKVFAFLPNLLSAAAILFVGWFVARIVQRIVESLLASAGVDRLSEKWGLSTSLGARRLSSVLGLLLYFLVLIPVFIAALNALQLDAVTQPASQMLAKITAALPNIFGALVIIVLAVVIGRVVAGIVTSLLTGLGFNNVLVKLGLARIAPQSASPSAPQGRQTPAGIVGTIVLAAIVLLASTTAFEMLGFPGVSAMIKDFMEFAGHILMGVLTFGLGLLLAQFVVRVILASDSPNARRFAAIARVVVLALAGAMALRQTGLADEIVNLAFGLTLGAVAVAAALAFGLGGREMAARTLVEWRDEQKKL